MSLDLEPLVRRADVDAETAFFGEGPAGIVVSGPRDALMELSKKAAELVFSRSDRSAETTIRLTAGAATIELSVEEARRLLDSGSIQASTQVSRTSTVNKRPKHAALRSAQVRVPPSEPTLGKLLERDGPRDECGVFGVYAPEHDVARLAYFALYALQHRGQESAGIATAENGHITTQRDLGLVSQVFDERSLQALTGEAAIGHVRYSTTGRSGWDNSQPVYRDDRRAVALGHNGNLINAVELYNKLTEEGVKFRSTSDSEIITALIARHPRSASRTPWRT